MNISSRIQDNTNELFGESVLSTNVIEKIADEYEKQEIFEKAYQEKLEIKIKELRQLILNSQNKMIYNLLYKSNYGDYNEYVEKIAAELRRRSDKRRRDKR